MIKVLIKRRFKEGKTKEILSLLNEFRAGALNMSGYISGVTMTSRDDQHVMLVIGTWEKMEHWNRWKENPARKAFEKMLEIYQEGPTVYEEYIVGTSFSNEEKEKG
jgi:quinol monooxygenase YgiN